MPDIEFIPGPPPVTAETIERVKQWIDARAHEIFGIHHYSTDSGEVLYIFVRNEKKVV